MTARPGVTPRVRLSSATPSRTRATKRSAIGAPSIRWASAIGAAMTPIQSARQGLCAARQALLLEAPVEGVEAVLAEERLAVEDHQRHAPVPSLALGGLVLLDHRVQASSFRIDGALEVGRVQPGALGGARKVVALVPVVDS